MMKVFTSLIAYFDIPNQIAGTQEYQLLPTNMTEMRMMIETRPRYPSNKITFNIANMAKGTTIRVVNIELNLNSKFDVDIFLEDSKRNFLNSFNFLGVSLTFDNLLRVQLIIFQFY